MAQRFLFSLCVLATIHPCWYEHLPHFTVTHSLCLPLLTDCSSRIVVILSLYFNTKYRLNNCLFSELIYVCWAWLQCPIINSIIQMFFPSGFLFLSMFCLMALTDKLTQSSYSYFAVQIIPPETPRDHWKSCWVCS